MPNRSMMIVVVLCLVTASGKPATAFDVRAVVREIDAENRTAVVFANGKERSVRVAGDARVLDENGKALKAGLASPELKAGAVVTLSVERNGNVMAIVTIRLGDRRNNPNGPARESVGRPNVGFKPLTEMTAGDRYKGEDGGLYGNGRNDPPDWLNAAATRVTTEILPRDSDGNPSDDGKIGLVSISMSNATQEFSRFKQLADGDSMKSSSVAIVDCAQGGQTMARWADPKAACWNEADRRLNVSGVSSRQVQVVWVKLANAGPQGELQEHGKQLERDTRQVLANLMLRFPNLKIAYLGSRIYGGYADGRLNPEPYAYEGAFVVRWLIQSQAESAADEEHRESKHELASPLLLWGPYFWADGTTPRPSDNLIWERRDFVGDGTHPSDSGRQKVARQLLGFFKTDMHAQTWFLRQ